MKKNLYLSPNYSKKKRLTKDIKFVVIHYTGMQSEIESRNRLKDTKAKVSCHYLINRKVFLENICSRGSISHLTS